MKSKHLTFPKLFCLVFKWSDHLIRQTIQKPDICDHKAGIFCPVSRPPFKNQTILQPYIFGPLKYQTCPVFRWWLYSNGLAIQQMVLWSVFWILVHIQSGFWAMPQNMDLCVWNLNRSGYPKFVPFVNRTCFDHWNTVQVQYLDPYCTWKFWWSSSRPVWTGIWNLDTCAFRLPNFRKEQEHSSHSNLLSASVTSRLWTRMMWARKLPGDMNQIG